MMRYKFIDTARGIAILLVVLGHCFSSAECGMNKVILSFHMPLFFFLSGIFSKPLAFSSLWGGVIHKVRLLLIPQLVLSITVLILNGGLWLADGNSITTFDFVSCFIYWFLPVLFSCAILFMVVSSLVDVNKRITQIIILVAVALSIMLSFRISVPQVLYWVRIIPTAFLFYLSGYLLKDRVLNYRGEHTSKLGLMILSLTAILYVLSQVNAPIKMYKNEYGIYSLFLITSSIGIFIVLSVCRILWSSRLLIEMGKISIAIYVWNFFVIGFFSRLTNYCMIYIGYGDKGIMTGITFLFSVISIYIIAKATYTRLPFMYGIQKI